MAGEDTIAPINYHEALGLKGLIEEIVTIYPVFEKTLSRYVRILAGQGTSYFFAAETLVRTTLELSRMMGLTRDDLLDCYAEFCFGYLRDQETFVETGELHVVEGGFQEIKKKVYDNQEYMIQYMMGLLISYALFPHHYRQYRFFCDRFVPQVSKEGVCCEFGVGHGLWLSSLMADRDGLLGIGYDISETCLKLSDAMMRIRGIPESKYRLHLADVAALELDETGYVAMVASGLLEHIENPSAFLQSIRPHLAPEVGRLFAMAPVNTAHPDHLLVFESVDAIKDLFAGNGFRLLDESAIPTADLPDDELSRQRIPIVHLGIYARE